MRDPRSILITGASSGIGEALARDYAAPGIFLALTGRDRARLDAVAAACRDKGAEVEAGLIDVADAEAMRTFIETVDARRSLDLVVANAGISGGSGHLMGEPEEQARRIMRVNVDGVLNTVIPAAQKMRGRKRGQLAIMSSLASFVGFPGAPAYCASKAAVRVWGEGLRGDLFASGIEVNVICPGYVVSRMTETNKFKMPLLMLADRASAIIRRDLSRNKPRIAFPWRLYFLLRLIAFLPPRWLESLFRRLPKKE
ncbi:MAG: SDR family NAD(P)-dependent oxidoreductase [Alphaproteobacteria bacterium]